MAYADLATLLSRAGRLAPAWDEQSQPSVGDLELYLVQAEATLDAALQTQGVPVPVTDTVAVGLARNVVADIALEMAIVATWPVNAASPGASILDSVRGRLYDQSGRLRLDSLLALTQAESASVGGAADLWTDEHIDDGNPSLPYERLPVGRSMRL